MCYPNGIRDGSNCEVGGGIENRMSASPFFQFRNSYFAAAGSSLSTIVIRNRPENSTELTYVQQSGDTHAITNSSTSNDDLTAYDNLNRLNTYRRGTLTASGNNGSGVLDTVTTGNLNTLAGSSQSWTLDALGNWSSLTTDGTATSRTHNSKNEVTAVGSNSLSFDNNGNTTVDQNGKHYVYDAWNQLITLKDTNNTTVLLSLTYDALENIVVYNNGSAGNIYHDSLGRWIESHYSLVHTQLVWAGDYLNDLILRDRNADNSTSTGGYGLSGSGLEERLYAQHDANWDVTSVLDTSAAVQLRYTYTPYGAVTTMDGTWATYDDSSTIQWAIKWQGERYEGTGDFYFMGARLYSPGLGRFLQQDPSGYIDGANVYAFDGDNSIDRVDPAGRDFAWNATTTNIEFSPQGWNYTLDYHFNTGTKPVVWMVQRVSGWAEFDIGSYFPVGWVVFSGWDILPISANSKPKFGFEDHVNGGNVFGGVKSALTNSGLAITSVVSSVSFDLKLWTAPPLLNGKSNWILPPANQRGQSMQGFVFEFIPGLTISPPITMDALDVRPNVTSVTPRGANVLSLGHTDTTSGFYFGGKWTGNGQISFSSQLASGNKNAENAQSEALSKAGRVALFGHVENKYTDDLMVTDMKKPIGF
jgi:RHS repeat-associated protein